jgi:leader peptidase (prepilin peptidase)/N-methyltransferase
MAMIGAMVGPGRSLLTVFIASALGSVTFLAAVLPVAAWRARRAGRELEVPLVPFGVFLAPAGLVALLWGDALVAAYLSYSGF